MAEVRLINVWKQFGDFTAVREMNLHVKDGEFMILLGPSGCGKTTTLRMIAGLEEPTKGQIYIGDRLVATRRREFSSRPRTGTSPWSSRATPSIHI